MKNPKLILAYLSIPLFCVFGFVLFLSLIQYRQGNEDYGIFMAVISGLTFYPIIILGLISLMIDLVGKRKPLPKLTWILLLYPLFTLLHLFIPTEWELINMDVALFIACLFSICLIIKDILGHRKQCINYSE